MNSKEEMKEQNKNESQIKKEANDANNKIKINNFKNFLSNNEKFRMKKNIIIKISNQLVTNKINLIEDNTDNLDLLQIIDILNKFDNSFSCFFFNDNKSFGNEKKNNNNMDFYFQQEYNIIKNIYSKITKEYDINFNESLEIINNNFINISNKQINSNSFNKFNNNFYYIYNILYNFIILFLIISRINFNNNEIKYLSPVDRIFLCNNQKEQQLICKILNTYLDINSYVIKENIFHEIKSVYFVISLYTSLNILKTKLKSNNIYNSSNVKEEENNNNIWEYNSEIKNEENNYKNYNNLSHQDFYKIILKKDFIINQLEAKIENLDKNTNENIFRDLEEENEINKKEIEDMKKKYDLEFELMASAVYGLGINLFFSKEQQHNEQINNSSSWLSRQKDYIVG